MPRIDALLSMARRDLEPGEAELLLAHAAGRERTWLFAHGTDEAPPELVAAFGTLVDRRRAGEPVAYLVGRRGFWSLDLAVTSATLVPRPETERLVELALERLPRDRPVRVLDLGTGSGAVALAIARERPRARVSATDASEAALAVARANADAHDLPNVDFHSGHWFDAVPPDPYDLIASNPPYIAVGDPHLAQGDLRFEPSTALSSGPDGLDAIREIVAGALARLVPGGWLLLEHGLEQGGAVRALLEGAGFVDVATAVDLEDRDRVSLGRRPG